MSFTKAVKFAIIGAFSLFLAGCETPETVYTKLSEREVNEMIAVLANSGIASDRTNKVEDKIGVLYDLQINDKTQFAQAVNVLTTQGLPRKTYKNFGDVFKGDGMVSTPLEQKARYLYALSEELSQTLNDIDGVSNARVHIVLSEVDPISRQRMPASASVMIQHETRMDTTTLIPKVKKLLSTAIDGLSYENVNVVLFADGTGEKNAQSPILTNASFNTPSGGNTVMQQADASQNNHTVLSENNEGAVEYSDTSSNVNSILLLLIVLLASIVILSIIVIYLKKRQSPAPRQDLTLYE